MDALTIFTGELTAALKEDFCRDKVIVLKDDGFSIREPDKDKGLFFYIPAYMDVYNMKVMGIQEICKSIQAGYEQIYLRFEI